MRVVGLTGGIASGVSLVAGIFRELGAIVIEADQVSRQVVEPGTDVYLKIVEVFGEGVLQPDGAIDRRRLGAIIFNNASSRRRLNAITHPGIRRRIVEEIEQIRTSSPDAIAIIDVPLLLDTTGPESFDLDGVIVVSAPAQTQLDRLMARDGLPAEEAAKRLAAQRPVEEKAAEADWVIDNSGSVAETRRQVETLWRQLRGSSP